MIKGKVISAEQTTEAVPEIKFFTAPVPVSRQKLPIAAIVVIQLLISGFCGVVLSFGGKNNGELISSVAEIVRRILNA